VRAQRFKDVVAYGALERMQVGAQECRHAAGEQHLRSALRTRGTLDCSERNDGRGTLKFCHNASFEQA
jgi:hypothetical protein